MNLNLTGHHLDITPAIRDYVVSKLDRVTRHFDHVIDVNVVLSVDKLRAEDRGQRARARQGHPRRGGRARHVRRDRRARRQARPAGAEAQGKARRRTAHDRAAIKRELAAVRRRAEPPPSDRRV